MPLTELQSGGLVAPWRDKQQAATGIRGIQMTLTVHAFFHTFDTVAEAQKLQRHQWNSLYSCEMKKKNVLRITELQCDLRIMPVIVMFSKNISL